jgi:hypothetical protein
MEAVDIAADAACSCKCGLINGAGSGI